MKKSILNFGTELSKSQQKQVGGGKSGPIELGPCESGYWVILIGGWSCYQV